MSGKGKSRIIFSILKIDLVNEHDSFFFLFFFFVIGFFKTDAQADLCWFYRAQAQIYVQVLPILVTYSLTV